MKSLRLMSVVIVATSLGGCDKIPFLGGGGSDPAEVARLYWAAMARQDFGAAEEHAVVTDQGTTVSLADNTDIQISNLVVADAQIGGDRAVSRTTMHASGDGSEADLDFSTTLIRVDGDWKVNQNETISAMMQSAIGQMFGAAVNQMGQAMGEAAEGMAQGLAQGMAEAVQQMGREQPARVRTPQPRTPTADPLAELPWEPEMIGTVDPGMTRDQVVGIWGEPIEERFVANRSYLYFRNGCERRCGTFDVVLLEGNQVIDAVVRGPGHFYSGISSSPPDRVPEETPPDHDGLTPP